MMKIKHQRSKQNSRVLKNTKINQTVPKKNKAWATKKDPKQKDGPKRTKKYQTKQKVMLGYIVFFLMYLLYFLFQLWFSSEIDVFFGWPYYEDWKYFCIFYLHYLFQLWFLSEINVFCGCPYYVDWMYGWSEIGRPACNGAAAGGGIAPNKPTLPLSAIWVLTSVHVNT